MKTRPKCASLGPEKSRSISWPARFQFRTDSCKHPNRATFCSHSAVKGWNLVIFLPLLESCKHHWNRICTDPCKQAVQEQNFSMKKLVWTRANGSKNSCNEYQTDVDIQRLLGWSCVIVSVLDLRMSLVHFFPFFSVLSASFPLLFFFFF